MAQDHIKTILADEAYLSGLPDGDFRNYLATRFNAQNLTSVFHFMKDYVDIENCFDYGRWFIASLDSLVHCYGLPC